MNLMQNVALESVDENFVRYFLFGKLSEEMSILVSHTYKTEMFQHTI